MVLNFAGIISEREAIVWRSTSHKITFRNNLPLRMHITIYAHVRARTDTWKYTIIIVVHSQG